MSGTLEVQGEGRANAVPDHIRLSFSVSGSAVGYREAVEDLNEKTDELRRLVEAAGVDRTAVKTVDFEIEDRWRTVEKVNKAKGEKTKDEIFEGYTASHSLRLELKHDKEQINKLLSLITSGEHQAHLSVNFFVSDPESLRKRAMADAARVARENAEILAREAGVKLVKVLKVNYGWSEVRFGPLPSMQYMDVCACEASPDFEPDKVGDTQRVTIVYEIE